MEGWPPKATGPAVKEALIKSLFDYTLVFSCNTRNNPTRIASYLKQSCIGLLSQDKLALSLHIKAPSFYSWPIYDSVPESPKSIGTFSLCTGLYRQRNIRNSPSHQSCRAHSTGQEEEGISEYSLPGAPDTNQYQRDSKETSAIPYSMGNPFGPAAKNARNLPDTTARQVFVRFYVWEHANCSITS